MRDPLLVSLIGVVLSVVVTLFFVGLYVSVVFIKNFLMDITGHNENILPEENKLTSTVAESKGNKNEYM